MNKIAFYCDFGKIQGHGHFSRQLNLYKSLSKKKECFFLFTKKQIENAKKIYNKAKFIKTNDILNHNQNLKILKKNNISIIIIDSYLISYKDEINYKKNNIFVVSFDDFNRSHGSNLVFTSINFVNKNKNNLKSQHWFYGHKYNLIQKPKIKKVQKNKILIHGGGQSHYELFEEFLNETITFFTNKKYSIDILSTTKKSRNFLKFKILKKINNKKINIINYIDNLSNNLSTYEIVCGPLGVTTFETILSKTLPVTFSINKDKYYNLSDWIKLNHLMHLKFFEKKNPILIRKLWEYTIKNYFILKMNIKLSKKILDGNGFKRVEKLILSHYKKFKKKKNIYRESNIKKSNFYSLEKCDSSFKRLFLDARNRKINRLATRFSAKKINWFEHLEWWNNKNIKKFIIRKGSEIKSFFWLRSFKINEQKYLYSGWFLKNSSNTNIKLANKTIELKVAAAKKYFKDYIWIIFMKKSNTFVKYLNLKNGFKTVNKTKEKKIKKIFELTDDYLIMEMKI